MLFVCYPKCTTCQKAKKWLDEKGISYTLRDIKTENPTQEELRTWWQESGLPLNLLATDGMLVKRPILVGERFVKVGFREKEWEEIG